MVAGGRGGTINYSEGKTTSWLDQQISKQTKYIQQISRILLFSISMFIYEKGMEQNLSNILYLHHIMFDMLHFIKYHRVKQKGTENAIKNELSNKFPLSRNDISIACVGWFRSINCLLIDIKLSFEF